MKELNNMLTMGKMGKKIVNECEQVEWEMKDFYSDFQIVCSNDFNNIKLHDCEPTVVFDMDFRALMNP